MENILTWRTHLHGEHTYTENTTDTENTLTWRTHLHGEHTYMENTPDTENTADTKFSVSYLHL